MTHCAGDTLQEFLPDFYPQVIVGQNLDQLALVGDSRHGKLTQQSESANMWWEQTRTSLSPSQSNMFEYFEPVLDAVECCVLITNTTANTCCQQPTANEKE